MKRKLFFGFLFVLLFCFVYFLQISFVYTENVGGNKAEIDQLNQSIAEKKTKIQQLEKSIADYKEKINQKRLESSSLANQMAILDNHTVQIDLDIQVTEEKLSSLALELESLQLSIEDKEKSINKQKEMLGSLIRTIYKESDKNYLEIATNYDNFSSFFNKIQYLKNIQSDMGASVSGLKVARTELEDKRQEVENIKNNYEETKKDLEEKKKTLGEQKNLKQNLLYQTQSSELKYQTLVANLKKQYQQIENEVSGIEKEIRAKLESENKLDSIVGDSTKLSWPTQSRYVTARFHDPGYPFRHIFEHSGLDIRSAQGTPLKAAASGYVARAKYCSLGSCYSYVMLVHSEGISTVYGHMSNINVKEDQFVARGDIIGYSGGTPGTSGAGPFVTGPHLHFEVRKNGIPVNPLNYLVKDW